MKYYKFNRDRSLDPLQKYIKSCRKLGHLAKKDNLHMLDSFHFENQTWGALHKAWKGYVIAKNKDEPDSSFPELDLLALQFFRDNPEYTDKELTGEDIFKLLMERDKDLLTKLYEGTYEEE